MTATVSPVVATCLGLLTLGWPIAMQQMIRLWHHTTTFFDVGDRKELRYRRARVRAMPAAVVAGLPLLAAAWLFVVSAPARQGSPNAPQVIALICSIVVIIDIFGVVPAIFLFNVPKRLVPPHLRNQPGFIKDGREGP